MGAFAGLLCSCGAGAAVLLVAGALLRLAATLANRLIGSPRPAPAPAPGGLPEWDWDDWDDEFGTVERPRPRKNVIPEPGIGKSMLIMLITAVVSVIGFLLLLFFAQEIVGLRIRRDEEHLVIALLNLPVGFGALSISFSVLAPTTFWRAALTAFLYHIVVVAVCLVAGLVVFGCLALAR